jgi:hypothetical protein
MPPATFIAATGATFPVSGTTGISVLVPSTTKPGDTLLVIVPATSVAAGDVDAAHLPSGWSLFGRFVSAGSKVINVVRRIATDAEPASHLIPTIGVASNVGGVLLVYRGLDPNAAIVAGAISDITNSLGFTCPSLVLTSYSDLYLGVAFVATNITPFTPPAGTTARFDAGQAPPGFTDELGVFELLREATGATGTQVATIGSNETGLAAAIAIKAIAPLVPPSITPDVAGAIGLVTVGV